MSSGDKIVQYLERRIKHCEKRVSEYELLHKGKEDKHTYHGGRVRGYWNGLLDGYINTLTLLKEGL